jgi:peptide/nickel transport system permease protein
MSSPILVRSTQDWLHRIGSLLGGARREPGLVIPCAILFLAAAIALLAPVLSPYSPTEGSLLNSLEPPVWQEGGSMEHILGTDFQGRDVLSRLIHGSRVSLAVAGVSIFVAGFMGLVLGLTAGYFGKAIDALIMRVADMFFALPMILFALLFAMTLGPSFRNVIIVIVLTIWGRFARQVRGEVLSVRERDFVALARVAGASNRRILITHILPNVANSVIVLATWQVGLVILMEASLSFLGVGIPPPTPSWGTMVADGRLWIASAWWVSVIPGMAILVTILAMNMVGDWLRDFLDPKLRQL